MNVCMSKNVSDLVVIVVLIYGIMQNLLPFLGSLLRKSSEAYQNFSVIKSVRESENLQVYFIWVVWLHFYLFLLPLAPQPGFRWLKGG